MKNIYLSKTEKETFRIGKKISKILKPGNIVCLFGDLGSGKTVLTKGIAQGLGIAPEDIHSPTFTLMNIYFSKKVVVYHFDLYRIENPKELMQVGYEDFFYGTGITVVEWADRLGMLLPKERVSVEIRHRSKKERMLYVEGHEKGFKDCARQLIQ